MKLRLLIIIQILFLCSVCAAGAQSGAGSPDNPAAEPGSGETETGDLLVDDDMIEILELKRDDLFPITSLKEYFNPQEPAVYSDDGPDTVIRIGTESGKKHVTIFANADGIHDHSGFVRITEEYPTDFQLSMDVTVRDVYPASEGGCFVGFTNNGVSAFSGKDGGMMAALMIDAKEASIYVKGMDEDSGRKIPVPNSVRGSAKLTIIHLTGHTYVFINDAYAGQYHDGLKGPFQMLYGAAILSNGDTAACQFDNLVIKKVEANK